MEAFLFLILDNFFSFIFENALHLEGFSGQEPRLPHKLNAQV